MILDIGFYIYIYEPMPNIILLILESSYGEASRSKIIAEWQSERSVEKMISCYVSS